MVRGEESLAGAGDVLIGQRDAVDRVVGVDQVEALANQALGQHVLRRAETASRLQMQVVDVPTDHELSDERQEEPQLMDPGRYSWSGRHQNPYASLASAWARKLAPSMGV